MGGEVFGEIVEKVGIPGGFVHVVDWFDEAAADEAGPEAVDDGARESAVGFAGDKLLELLQALGLVGFVIERT